MLEAWNAGARQRRQARSRGARARAVSELQPDAATSHAEIAAGERLEIAYEGPRETWQMLWKSRLPTTCAGASTTIGPHHDDLSSNSTGRRPAATPRRASSGPRW